MRNGFDVFQQGGPVMWPLLLISILAVAFAVERLIAYYYFGRTAPGLAEDVIRLLKEGKGGDALRLAEETPGPVAASVASVLRHRDLQTQDIKREVAFSAEDYFVRLERFLPTLDTFTTLSPLLGLLGTILGMVRVFQKFNLAASEEAKADILAGVGESLYATAFGIAVAVFCFAVYNYFSARQRSLSIDADRAANQVIGYLSSQRPVVVEEAGRRRHVRSLSDKGRTLKKTKIEIIPMIDTMFFLLVFFILSSVGIIKLQGLPVNLPVANSSDRQNPAKITVSITPTQQIKINNRDVQAGDDIGKILLDEVKLQTGGSATAIAQAQVVINADRDTPSGAVVRVLDSAAAAGVGRVSVATQKGAAPETAAP